MPILISTRRGLYLVEGDDVLASLEEEREFLALAAAPSAPGLCYSATADGQVYRSGDGGGTWEAVGAIPEYVELSSLAVSPEDPHHLLAGMEPAALFRSSDGGLTWNEDSVIRGMSETNGWSVPWSEALGHVRNIAVDPREPRRIYLAIEVGGVVRTEDDGATWENVRGGIHDDVHMVAVDPSAFAGDFSPETAAALPDVLLQGKVITPEQLARVREISEREGTPITDVLIRQGVEPFVILQATAFLHNMKAVDLKQHAPAEDALEEISPEVARRERVVPIRRAGQGDHEQLICAVDSPNKSLAWQNLQCRSRFWKVGAVLAWPEQISEMLDRYYPAPAGESGSGPRDTGSPRLYAATRHGFGISEDYGRSWRRVDGFEGQGYSRMLALHPGRPGRVFAAAATAGPSSFSRPTGAECGIFRSDDGGETWAHLSNGIPAYFRAYVDAIGIDPADPDHVALGDGEGNVYVSRDGGGSWRETLSLPPIRRLLML